MRPDRPAARITASTGGKLIRGAYRRAARLARKRAAAGYMAAVLSFRSVDSSREQA